MVRTTRRSPRPTTTWAVCCGTKGNLAGARVAFQRALAIDEAAYGPDHPAVATDVNNLGGAPFRKRDVFGE